MIANYGYKDGSGDYFIAIDTGKCATCPNRACAPACPAGVLEIITDDYDDTVAAVRDEQRKKIKYSCAPCKPLHDRPILPCVAACGPAALVHSW
jgi:Fe-S-cluster-containing hydrogenase component 2